MYCEWEEAQTRFAFTQRGKLDLDVRAWLLGLRRSAKNAAGRERTQSGRVGCQRELSAIIASPARFCDAMFGPRAIGSSQCEKPS
jgi:hypothetical protein